MMLIKAVMLVVVALVPARAYARLGETLEQCTKRYGKPFKKKGNDFDFKKNGFIIHVIFLKNGKAGRIDFVKIDGGGPKMPGEITYNEKLLLLKANSQGKKWVEIECDSPDSAWKRSDGAKALYSGRMLLIMTKESMKVTFEAKAKKEKKKLEGF
jgi:hypothetical protein